MGTSGFATGSGFSSTAGSTSQTNKEAVVESVLSQLGPSITAAVEAALASSQSSTSQQQSLQAQQAKQAQLLQQSQQFSSSSSTQATESELVSQIITALTPSITFLEEYNIGK